MWNVSERLHWDCHWRALTHRENEEDASCINLCPFPQNVRSSAGLIRLVLCNLSAGKMCALHFNTTAFGFALRGPCLSVMAEFSLEFFLLLNCVEGTLTTDVILSYYDGRNISICLLLLTWDSLKHVWIILPGCMLLKRLLSVMMSSYECCAVKLRSVLNLPNNVACSLEQCSICKCKLVTPPPRGTK